MRIISGELGGRKLHTIPGSATRPAMSRTRESLFSMLEARGLAFGGKRALDLFAGCGSLGLEALSRGAAHATFVDNSAAACACIARNIRELRPAGQGRIAQQSVNRFLGRPPELPYDMVFIDPPYRRDFVSPALKSLLDHNWLGPDALISAEVEKSAQIAAPAGLVLLADRLFGQTRVVLWQKNEVKNEDGPLSGNI